MFNSHGLNSCTFTLRGTGFKKNWLWSMQELEAVFISWRKLTLMNAKIGITFTLFGLKKKKLWLQKMLPTKGNSGENLSILK